MKTYQIFLIAHASAEGSAEGRYIGHTDAPLSEEGREHLNEMKNTYAYPDAQVVFTGPLKRCTQTAAVLYPDKSPIVLDGFIECNFGEFENMTAEELKNNEAFALWLSGKSAPPFGESSEHFGKRVCSTFEKTADGMMKSGVFSAAIITHSGVIGAILSAYGLPEAPIYEWMSSPCCGYALRLDPAMWMRGKKFEVFGVIPGDYRQSD